MGNNVTCKIVGIRSIRIKIYDGIVRNLTYVRHVPELRKKLISMGVLDDAGYKFAVQLWSYEDIERYLGCYEGKQSREPV